MYLALNLLVAPLASQAELTYTKKQLENDKSRTWTIEIKDGTIFANDRRSNLTEIISSPRNFQIEYKSAGSNGEFLTHFKTTPDGNLLLAKTRCRPGPAANYVVQKLLCRTVTASYCRSLLRFKRKLSNLQDCSFISKSPKREEICQEIVNEIKSQIDYSLEVSNMNLQHEIFKSNIQAHLPRVIENLESLPTGPANLLPALYEDYLVCKETESKWSLSPPPASPASGTSVNKATR